MSSSPLTVGSTYNFDLNPAKKDGVTWDLSAATVTLYFLRPDGSRFSKLASVIDGPNGHARYTTAAGATPDLNMPGDWSVTFRVQDGAVDIRSLPQPFTVENAP